MADPAATTKIWTALRARAALITRPVAWPGAVYRRNLDQPFVEVSEILADPLRVMIDGTEAHQRDGTLQIMLLDPAPVDYGAVRADAEEIANLFPADLRLREDGVEVRVLRAPQISEGFQEAGWWQTPIRIRWRAFA